MLITAEVVITGCRCRCIDGLSSGFVRANRTVESALDQTLRAQSRGIVGIQFRSALRTIWHFGRIRSSYFMPFAPDAVTSSPAIPYSCSEPDWTGRDQLERRFVMKTFCFVLR